VFLEQGHKEGQEELFRQLSRAWKRENSGEVGNEKKTPHSKPLNL